MQEKISIGKVTLNFKHYSGVDLYSDGSVENDLLEIVRKYKKEDYQKVIEEKANWPILYHLSDQRANIVEWIPMDPNAKVLEVGSGCGAITGMLASKAKEVVACDLSRRRSEINATRNQDCGNVTIHVGNFRDVEPDLPRDFDYIFLIGVFEYAQGYIGTDNPYEKFLRMMNRHLKKGGRISSFAAKIGTVLHVKPVLTSNYCGEIVMDKKVRGRKLALQALAESFSKNFDRETNDPVGIAYAGCESDANFLVSLLKKAAPHAEFLLTQYEPVTGSHVGPGTVALFYTCS